MLASKTKVLIVDDEPEWREFLKLILIRRCQCAVAVAEDGADALAQLSDQTVDIILLDAQMPVMNGETFRSAQLKDDALKSVYTILVSATAIEDGTAARIRADAVLTKPFASVELVKLIQGWESKTRGVL